MQRTFMPSNSYLENNSTIVENFFGALCQTDDKEDFKKEVQNLDQELYKFYAAQNYPTNEITKQLYEQPVKQAIKLDIPKQHSLSDSMLKTTLGSEEKYAQKYMQLIDQTKKIEEDEKKRRVEEAKRTFAMTNSHNSFVANSKPFMEKRRFAQARPVLENQHDLYVKTHLTFLDRPNPSSENREFTSRFTDGIAKKIEEMGGIQNTLEPIETSLEVFEMRRNQKKDENRSKSKTKRNFHSPSKTAGKVERPKDGWLDKSKQMRQTLEAQFLTS